MEKKLSETNFVGCVEDFEQGKVLVWERPVEGGPRKLRLYDPPRYCYVADDNGEYETITKQKVTRRDFDDGREFNQFVKSSTRKIFESDIRPDSRIMMNEYFGRPTPVINYAFFDIELDVIPGKWATPSDAYAPINGITLWQSWTKEYLCYAIPPKKWSEAERESFVEDVAAFAKENKLEFVPKVRLFNTEFDLLRAFTEDISDADLLSGWNSELFDIPYTIARLKKLFGDNVGPAKLCFPGAGAPKMRVVEVFGNEEIAYDLRGRSHVDYMNAFKKFTFEGRTSYSLANIAADELDVDKIDLGISFDEMYNKFFYKFCVYNARDVEILVKLDQKFNFIQLINQMAHENTVPYSAIMGTVRYVDMGITNRVHRIHGRVSINKPTIDENEIKRKVEGAVVFNPKYGLWRWLGSVDINSLYPSVIRALNMSFETFVGQFVNEVDDWRGIMDNRQRKRTHCPNGLKNVRYRSPETLAYDFNEKTYTLLLVSGKSLTKTAPEWRAWLKENNYAMSAFGTVFDQKEEGVVAETLTFWFAERKRLQKEKKLWGAKIKQIVSANSVETVPAGQEKNYVKYKKVWLPETVYHGEEFKHAKHMEEHYDLLQLTKKIQLNSTYGALLNKSFRYNRREIGASTTGTGREITIFMSETIGEALGSESSEIMKCVEVDKKGEISNSYFSDSEYLIYGDTDSNYFMMPVDNKEDAVEIADLMAETVNAVFPTFMSEMFYCTDERSKLISAAREVVAIRGLFLNAKKKYTLRVVDKEGTETDELKFMGSELKKADTPKPIQKFLKHLMDIVLDDQYADVDGMYPVLEKFVNANRKGLIHKTDDVLALGVAKQINNLEEYTKEWKQQELNGTGKAKLPGHVRAAVNFNHLADEFSDNTSKRLRSGDKGVIFYLRPNEYKIKTIAFPADTMRLPDWFNDEFRVDFPLTEEKMIDLKLEGIFEALGKPVPTPKLAIINKEFVRS